MPYDPKAARALHVVLTKLEADPKSIADEFVRKVLWAAFCDFHSMFFDVYNSDRRSNTYGWKQVVEGIMSGTVDYAMHDNGSMFVDSGGGMWARFRGQVEELDAIISHEFENNMHLILRQHDIKKLINEWSVQPGQPEPTHTDHGEPEHLTYPDTEFGNRRWKLRTIYREYKRQEATG